MARRAPDAPLTSRTDRRDRADVADFNPDTLPVWSPQWEAIEKAWFPDGGALSTEARQDIEQAVNAYMRREFIARTVPFHSDVKYRIEQIQKAAHIFANALSVFKQGDGSREALSRLTPFLATAADDDPHLERLPRDLDAIIHAAGMALADMNPDISALDTDADAGALNLRPFKKWDAWNTMILKLYGIAGKHRLPTTINNNNIGRRDVAGDPVPFIDAIMAIEGGMMADYQRYDTRGALANAVLCLIRSNRKSDK